MEQTLENGIADNFLHNIFNDLSVGLELYDKDGLMIDVNYSRLRSMGIKDKKDILGYNLFNYTSFSDEIKEQIRKGETVRFMAKYDFDDLCRLFPTNLSGIKFFEITVSFVHNEKSEITNYMVISQDVTERVLWQNKYDNLYEEVVRSKKELLESEQRMIHLIRQNELVLNNINSGLAYIANDYIVQWENISLCSKSLSYEAYKKGEPCYLTAHNRTTPCENCVMQRARQSGQVESILFNLDNKHVIEVFATPIFTSKKTKKLYVSTHGLQTQLPWQCVPTARFLFMNLFLNRNVFTCRQKKEPVLKKRTTTKWLKKNMICPVLLPERLKKHWNRLLKMRITS